MIHNKLLLAAAAAAFLAGSASATTVLYRVDDSLGMDDMAGALATLGYTVTSTSGDLTGFTLTDYDVVVYANQNSGIPGGDVTTLETYVSGGGKLIFTDWLTGAPSNLGGDFTGNVNETEVTVGALFGVGVASPITLVNPGWGIFSTGLLANGASVEGTFGNGEAAILLGNGGRTIWNGFLFDTSVGEQLFINQLTFLADGAVIPEPATWAMMIAGFGLVGFAARRRRVLADA